LPGLLASIQSDSVAAVPTTGGRAAATTPVRNGWTVLQIVIGATLLVTLSAAFGFGAGRASATGQSQIAPSETIAAPIQPATAPSSSAAPFDSSLLRQLHEVPAIQVGAIASNVSLRLPIEFGPGTALLPAAGQDSVKRLAAILSGVNVDVIAEGRTDAKPMRTGGQYPNNEALALARAESVLRVFRESGQPKSGALTATAQVLLNASERTVVIHLRSRQR
jgi:outer membrane protein OmpA-like peptidoglycan-associated protein